MGDTYKQAIFAEHLQATLHGWAAEARKRKRPRAPGISWLFGGMFGRGAKKQNTSGGTSNGVQMQSMTFESCESAKNAHQQPDTSERILVSSGEMPQIH